MIPVDYMYKILDSPGDQIFADNVINIDSVGQCNGSGQFFDDDYINNWKHNGYWFYNSPAVIERIADEKGIDLTNMTLFYYEAYKLEFHRPYDSTDMTKRRFKKDDAFETDVVEPVEKKFVGYDVVLFTLGNSSECSLLACSGLTKEFSVNENCLFTTFDQAEAAAASGKFHDHEPGPFRIFAVYQVA
jgi:hypothetical protein